MTSAARRTTRSRTARLAAVAALFASALSTGTPALAQYKVVGPDGKVTYTDRPPVTKENKVQPLASPTAGGAPAPGANLPFDLQQVVRRYPVTLYTGADCAPCDAGRQLLRQRGVPFSERTVEGNDGATALRRVTGGDTLPAVTIGTQLVNGFASLEWSSYLDAAGYPKASRLPSNYAQAPATPLAERRTAPAQAAPQPAQAPAAAPAPEVAAPPPGEGGIRF